MADYVLTQYTGKKVEERLALVAVLKEQLTVIEAELQKKLTGVPPATQTTYGGIKISGSITENPPTGAYGVVSMAGGLAYVPMASYDTGTGTATTGVVTGEDWYELKHAAWAASVLTGGVIPDGMSESLPLKVSDEGEAGYSIGLWQDGNTYHGGSIPLASSTANGLLSKDYQPYLSALWDIYEDGDDLKDRLQDVDGTEIGKLADRVSALEAGGGTEASIHFKELGLFQRSGEAEAVAAEPANAGNRDLVLMHYTLANGGSGIIMQQVDGAACTQIIGLGKCYYHRTIAFTGTDRTEVQEMTDWTTCFVDELNYNASSRVLALRWGANFIVSSATLPLASSSVAGLMSAQDKTTLDGIPSTYATQESLRTVGKMASEAQAGYINNAQAISDLTTQVDDLNTNVGNLLQSDSAHTASITDHEKRIKALETSSASVNKFLDGYLDKTDDFDLLYAGLDARISELEENGGGGGGTGDNTALVKRIKALEEQVAALTALLQMA